MSEQVPTRETIRAALKQHRAALHSFVDGRSTAQLEAIRFSEAWNGLDALRHMLVWDELAVGALKDWQNSSAVSFDGAFDDWNEAQVAALQSLDLKAVMHRLDAAYEYMAHELEHNSDDELAVESMAPWGYRATRLNAIGVFYHDMEHLEELV